MIPLSSATSGGLTWSRVSSRNFELNRSGQVIGRLRRPSLWSCSFQAETQTERWTFRRSGWLGGCFEILDSASQQPIATFKPAWGGRGGKLIFVDGQTFQLKCKGWWRPVWSVIAESDEAVLRLLRRKKNSGIVLRGHCPRDPFGAPDPFYLVPRPAVRRSVSVSRRDGRVIAPCREVGELRNGERKAPVFTATP